MRFPNNGLNISNNCLRNCGKALVSRLHRATCQHRTIRRQYGMSRLKPLLPRIDLSYLVLPRSYTNHSSPCRWCSKNTPLSISYVSRSTKHLLEALHLVHFVQDLSIWIFCRQLYMDFLPGPSKVSKIGVSAFVVPTPPQTWNSICECANWRILGVELSLMYRRDPESEVKLLVILMLLVCF
jgi:hypothetical protein